MARKPKGQKRVPRGRKERAAEVKRQENIAAALDFRRQGYSYSEIAAEMGHPTSTVYGWVRDGLAAIPEEAAEAVRKMELDRLDFMQSRLFSQFSEYPEMSLIDGILKIMDKRARYLGLYKDGGFGGAIGGMMDDAKKFFESLQHDRPVLQYDGAIPLEPVL